MFIITFGEIQTMIFIEFHKKVPSESEIPGFQILPGIPKNP